MRAGGPGHGHLETGSRELQLAGRGEGGGTAARLIALVWVLVTASELESGWRRPGRVRPSQTGRATSRAHQASRSPVELDTVAERVEARGAMIESIMGLEETSASSSSSRLGRRTQNAERAGNDRRARANGAQPGTRWPSATGSSRVAVIAERTAPTRRAQAPRTSCARCSTSDRLVSRLPRRLTETKSACGESCAGSAAPHASRARRAAAAHDAARASRGRQRHESCRPRSRPGPGQHGGG